ncbi:hypothetical protein TrLO_g780 [Triparma laevis f. longispina]|uniref:Uncharacterized protein n=1 Tax=Triparma laevis f. longispina TaxID=1714387 RepID=A0A9W7F3U1_9STRA|nr:hypothetical protein TrLO_g780 [Triparma laevis f. longispina]
MPAATCSIISEIGFNCDPSLLCGHCHELLKDAVVCDCKGPNNLHYFCEDCTEGDSNVGSDPEVVQFRKERFMGICPTSGIKSCIREDWRKRTKVSNLKLQTCPYAQGYVEFPEYAELIPGRKLESPNEEYLRFLPSRQRLRTKKN